MTRSPRGVVLALALLVWLEGGAARSAGTGDGHRAPTLRPGAPPRAHGWGRGRVGRRALRPRLVPARRRESKGRTRARRVPGSVREARDLPRSVHGHGRARDERRLRHDHRGQVGPAVAALVPVELGSVAREGGILVMALMLWWGVPGEAHDARFGEDGPGAARFLKASLGRSAWRRHVEFGARWVSAEGDRARTAQ